MSDLSRRAKQAARRLADQTSDRLNGVPAERTWILTVIAVALGASPKGNAVITVLWRGSPIVASDYYASYTPAVGDRVSCIHTADNQLIVQDRLAG